jgi:hydroxymethylpyrimidine/phosphomethylpyrimidine kinase
MSIAMTDEIQSVLLCIGGQDPSGGAGIQADAEAARAAGVHACCVVTCLTSQDSCGISGLWPQKAEQVEAQCRLILADSHVGAIKVGLLGGSRNVRILCDLVTEQPTVPLVLDPVLASGTGQQLADAAQLNQMRNNLIGRCTLVTPNLPEAQSLTNFKEPDECARRLLQTGCPWVLITGAHAPGAEVINWLYGRDGTRRDWSWPRLPGQFHGSGCTLASAIAARIVLGMDILDAVAEAQSFTWDSLSRALRTGRCQLVPNRLYALDADDHGARRATADDGMSPRP